MKRSLWIASSIAAVALSATVMGTGTSASTRGADLSGLQRAISTATVVDLSAAQGKCRVCFKDPTRCLRTCQSVSCPGGC
jgi:hypothetical protein